MIKIKNTENFKRAIDQISIFVDDCNIRLNDEGLTIRAFDVAQMLYLEYFLPSSGLSGELDSNIVGINISEFNKVIAKVQSTDTIYIDFEQNDFHLILEGEYKRRYSFSVKDIEDKEFSVDNQDYHVNISLKGAIIKDIFSSAKVVCDSLVLESDKKSLHLYSDGLYGKYKTSLDFESKKEFKVRFSTSYLNNILRNADNSSNISLSISNDKPIIISYQIGENNLKFFLASMFI